MVTFSEASEVPWQSLSGRQIIFSKVPIRNFPRSDLGTSSSRIAFTASLFSDLPFDLIRSVVWGEIIISVIRPVFEYVTVTPIPRSEEHTSELQSPCNL